MTPQELRTQLLEFFDNYVAMGLGHHPDAVPSHILVRSKRTEDLQCYKDAAAELGEVFANRREEDGKEFVFLRLHEPLRREKTGHVLQWIEFSQPDEKHITGIEALVYAYAGGKDERDIPDTPYFHKYLNISVPRILGLAA
jgi:hypothetical protein